MVSLKEKRLMKRATDKQQAVLDFIDQHLLDKGFPPELSKIGAALGIQRGAVQAHLRLLEKKGLVTWATYEARSIKRIHA